MRITNLTPHDINVVGLDGNVRTFPRTGQVARSVPTPVAGRVIDGIQTWTTTLGPVVGLPEPADDTIYIVSRIVIDRCPEREDLFAPGALLRDDKGVVVGCDGLSR